MALKKLNVNDNVKEKLWVSWEILLLLGGVFLLINFIMEMPYNKWLSENIPAWLSVFNCLLLGVCFVIMAIPGRPFIMNNLAGSVGLLAAIISKTTFAKALWINISILLISVILFIAVKHHYRKKEEQEKKGKRSGLAI